VKIGACFVLAIVVVSIASRIKRVFELRATEIEFDAASQVFVRDCARRTIRLVANQAGERDVDEYVEKLKRLRRDHDLPVDPDVIFVEVTVVDPSDFEGRLHVRGEVRCQRYRVVGDRSVGAQRAGRPCPAHPPRRLRIARSRPTGWWTLGRWTT
jgi:hypothetical protein